MPPDNTVIGGGPTQQRWHSALALSSICTIYLLLPAYWSSFNRVTRSERADFARAWLFGGVGLFVFALCSGARSGLRASSTRTTSSATFSSHRAVLAVPHVPLVPRLQRIVTALSTFFCPKISGCSCDACGRAAAVLARFAKTVFQSSWMVVVFLLPSCSASALRAARLRLLCHGPADGPPFYVIPVAAGTGTTLLVNVFPARRARDILMLIVMVFAGSIVLLLRFIQPDACCASSRCRTSLAFSRRLQSPITPMLPSFWAGETLFASLDGGRDLLHGGALWTTACAFTVILSEASEKWPFEGFSKSEETWKARFTQLTLPRHGSRLDCRCRSCGGSADERPQGVSARRDAMVAALLLRAPVSGLSVQLQSAGSGSHPVYEPLHQNFYAFLNLGLRDS